MARSSNLVIPEVTEAASLRRLVERIDLFNAGSNNTMTLSVDEGLLNRIGGGDHIEPIQLTRPSGIDAHVDEADPASADSAVTIAQAKGASVFQSRRAYIAHTRDEVMRGKFTPEQYSQAIGEMIADDRFVSIRERLIAIGVASIDSMDTPAANAHILDVSIGKAAGAAAEITAARLNTLLAKMGDAREDISTFVMHSSVFRDLVGDSITNYKVDRVAGTTLHSDVPAAFGRSIIVVDDASLTSALTSTYYDEYYTLGLGANQLNAKIISFDPISTFQDDSLKVVRWTTRQDYDVEFSVGGMKWVTAGTNVNPTDAELATAARWDEYLSDHRECKCVKLVSNIAQ